MSKRWFLWMAGMVFFGCGAGEALEDTSEPAVDIREVTSESGSHRVSYAPQPDPIPPVDLFSVEFAIVDAATGLPSDAVTVTGLEVSMPEHNHGMNVEPVLSELGAGVWEASPLKFHMTGLWTMLVAFETEAGADQALFELTCCESPG